MREIQLSQGKVALIDDEDFETLSKYRWFVICKGHTFYAATRIFIQAWKKRLTIRMHGFLVTPPVGLVIDHINGDGLDNRRINLRMATHSQNLANQEKRVGCSSIYKGVSWRGDVKKWAARIKRRHLGYFKLEIDAAKAYDEVALELFGEFARLNLEEGVPTGHGEKK